MSFVPFPRESPVAAGPGGSRGAGAPHTPLGGAARLRVLLLDDLVRGVDVAAKFDIQAVLRELAGAGAAILVSSSDQEELIALCSRIAILIDGRPSRIVPAAGLTPSRLLALCYGDRP